MLGIFALVFLTVLSLKLSLKLRTHKQIFFEHKVSKVKYFSLQLSPLLYIVSMFGLLLPFSWLDYFRPIPIGILLLVPGIILGKNISAVMDRVGFNDTAMAGRAANNIMWLGIGEGIIIACIIAIRLLFENISSVLPN